MNKGQKIALSIFTPIVVTLLMRLVFWILDWIINQWMRIGLDFLDVQWMFDIGENWVFWLASAVASVKIIVLILEE